MSIHPIHPGCSAPRSAWWRAQAQAALDDARRDTEKVEARRAAAKAWLAAAASGGPAN
jgi:hypothetical protein